MGKVLFREAVPLSSLEEKEWVRSVLDVGAEPLDGAARDVRNLLNTWLVNTGLPKLFNWEVSYTELVVSNDDTYDTVDGAVALLQAYMRRFYMADKSVLQLRWMQLGNTQNEVAVAGVVLIGPDELDAWDTVNYVAATTNVMQVDVLNT